MTRVAHNFANLPVWLCITGLLCLPGVPSNAVSATVDGLKQRSGKYEVSVRLPPDGLYAGEEIEIEFHIADMSRIDPVLGPTPLIRAAVRATITMPAMSGMPAIDEQAHPESVAGDYGIHPTFAHGGDYILGLDVSPPADKPFRVDIPLPVQDSQTGRSRRKKPPAYFVELSSTPKTPKAYEPADLQLAVWGRDGKKLVTQFDIAHERFLHLIIVRDDLAGFAHEHPESGPDGMFRLRYVFPAGGQYRLFADVAPKGAGSQVLMTKLKVSGKAGPRFAISAANRSNPVRSGAVTVQLKTPGPFDVKQTVPIEFAITDSATGAAAPDIQPYLGALGHLLMVHQDGETFVHSHPWDQADSGGRAAIIPFLARFPKPGLYRAWSQFQHGGVVHTADFVIEAK